MATVFLSYAREDARKAKALAESLEAAGHSVWWDRHIVGGSDYSKEIESSLLQSEVVVVLWSHAAIRSQWVRDEAATGRDDGRLVPVLLGEVEPPLGFRQLQSIPLSSWSGRGRPPNFELLLDAIAAHAPATTMATTEGGRAAPNSATRSRLITLALAALIGLLAAGGWFLWRNPPSALVGEEKISLAVLPFADLSPARDKSYFSEGVAEEILSTLANEPGLRVLGRTSARQIERNPDPRSVRASLGITHILEGSMRTDGNQLRVNVRLVDTRDGTEIWHDEYHGQLGDVFAVQDQIAARVVQNLRGTFRRTQGRSSLPGTASFQDYLAARALTRTRSRVSLSKAMELAKKSIAADPNHAAAHALLAELYIHLSDRWTAYGTMPIAEARRLALPHAQEAIRLAPNLADGHAALGLIVPAAESIKPLTRAMELDRSRAEPYIWLSTAMVELGRGDEALERARQAAAIEPLWAVPIHVVVQTLAASGRFDEALEVTKEFERRGGAKAQVHRLLAAVARWRGDLGEAAAHSRAALALDPNIPYLPALLSADYHLLGMQREALAVLPKELAFTQAVRTRKFARDFRLSDAPRVWTAPDGQMVIHALGARRDWQSLVAIYAAAPADRELLCEDVRWPWPILALALQKSGRSAEARELLACIEKRLDLESRSHARLVYPLQPEASDLEFRRATLLALKGDKARAIGWLSKAVDRGWVGRPFSTSLQDYPQFDVLKGDSRLDELQRKVDAKVAAERRQTLRTAAKRP